MRIIVLFFTTAMLLNSTALYAHNMHKYACTPEDKFKIVCETVCKQDGDEAGIVQNNSCYCANIRDISKILAKVPKNGKAILEDKPVQWLYER